MSYGGGDAPLVQVGCQGISVDNDIGQPKGEEENDYQNGIDGQSCVLR